MNITLQNVRSLKSAELNGGGITLVTGKNTSGKTSLMNAVAAAFLGDAKIYGATKADASHVIRKGEANASVRVSSGVQENGGDSPGDAWSETWGRGLIWPFEGDIIEHGVAPPADEITMGRVDPAHDFDKKQWADFIRKICGKDAAVKWPEVEAAMIGAHGTKQMLLEVKEALKTAGWDSTATMCANRAKDARRAWEKATGEHFGTDKANGWVHPAYQDLDGRVGLEAQAKDLEADLARAKAAGEVQNERKEDLEAEIKAHKAELAAAQSARENCDAEKSNLKAALAAYPQTDPLKCPCCGEMVELADYNGKLVKADPNALRRDSSTFGELWQRAQEVQELLDKALSAVGTAKAKLEAAESTIRRIGNTPPTNRDTIKIEEGLLDIRTRLDAQRITSAAGEAFSAWAFWNHASAVVGPLGVRYEATKTAVAKLQPKLDEIAKKIFPEHKVEIHANEDGLDLTFDGFDYRSMVWNGDPNSYKLGIQVMFQILHAEQLGPEAPILIDRADTLDKRRLGGVLNCLVQRKRVAIVAKTVAERPETDLLANAKVGKTYYINSGTVEAV